MTPTLPLPVPLEGGDQPSFILLFGGSFDPPHNAHVKLPVLVRDELERRLHAPGGGWLLYVPASRSPHKPGSPQASNADRLAMLERAIEASPRTAVWRDEIERAQHSNAPSFTVDTLGRARAWLDDHDLSGVPLYLLIGADQAASFHRWRSPRDILRLAKPVVMIRQGHVGGADQRSMSDAIEQASFWNAQELAMWASAVVNVGNMDVSSTAVRAAIAAADEHALSRFLAPEVAAYIRLHKLYGAK